MQNQKPNQNKNKQKKPKTPQANKPINPQIQRDLAFFSVLWSQEASLELGCQATILDEIQ